MKGPSFPKSIKNGTKVSSVGKGNGGNANTQPTKSTVYRFTFVIAVAIFHLVKHAINLVPRLRFQVASLTCPTMIFPSCLRVLQLTPAGARFRA